MHSHANGQTGAEQLRLPRSMHRMAVREDQHRCLEAYFVATQRPPELQTYLRGVADELFRRSVLVGYHVDGRIVGGFCLVTVPPVPMFEVLPDIVRRTHPFVCGVSEEETVSVAFLWLDKNLRGFVHSARLWLCMLSVVQQLGRPYLLYSYNLKEQKSWQLYKRGGHSTNIYEGMLKTGAIGGVDYLPLHHLNSPVEFLTRFLSRHTDRARLT